MKKKEISFSYLIINLFFKKLFSLIYFVHFNVNKRNNNKFIDQTIHLYPREGFGGLAVENRFYNAPFEKLEKLIPKEGTIIELGCGEGILTNYLAICSKKRRVIGIELSQKRVILANRGLPNTQFIQGDVLKKPLPLADVIVMSHMLHHLASLRNQVKLIKLCHKALKKKGLLVVAEIDRQWSFKYLLGWITDTLFVPILFEDQLTNFKIFHRSHKDWEKVFLQEGFKILSITYPQTGPFPDIFFVCQKI